MANTVIVAEQWKMSHKRDTRYFGGFFTGGLKEGMLGSCGSISGVLRM